MKIHVFIDAENVPVTNALEAYDVICEDDADCECDVVGKEGSLPQAYIKRRGKKFRIHNSDYGKNSADLYLTVLIAKAIYEERNTDVFAIVSNDRDFAPIVQLAVEKHKQVLLLGLSAQSQGMTDALERMETDMRFVTLGVIDDTIINETVTVEDLPTGLSEYYRKHYKGGTISVKRGEILIELPFIDGMHSNMFLDLLRRFGVLSKTQKLDAVLGKLPLKLSSNRVHRVEQPKGPKVPDHPKINRMPDDLKNLYREKFLGDTIFVKRENQLIEVPFINGMHLGRFIQLARTFNVFDKNQKMNVTREKLSEYGLKIQKDCVFYAD